MLTAGKTAAGVSEIPKRPPPGARPGTPQSFGKTYQEREALNETRVLVLTAGKTAAGYARQHG